MSRRQPHQPNAKAPSSRGFSRFIASPAHPGCAGGITSGPSGSPLVLRRPPNTHHAENLLLLIPARQVLAEPTCRELVDHRLVRLARHRIAELSASQRRSYFRCLSACDTARGNSSRFSWKQMERLLEHAADAARRVLLEGDVAGAAAGGDSLEVLQAGVCLVGADLADLEVLARFLRSGTNCGQSAGPCRECGPRQQSPSGLHATGDVGP